MRTKVRDCTYQKSEEDQHIKN